MLEDWQRSHYWVQLKERQVLRDTRVGESTPAVVARNIPFDEDPQRRKTDQHAVTRDDMQTKHSHTKKTTTRSSSIHGRLQIRLNQYVIHSKSQNERVSWCKSNALAHLARAHNAHRPSIANVADVCSVCCN